MSETEGKVPVRPDPRRRWLHISPVPPEQAAALLREIESDISGGRRS